MFVVLISTSVFQFFLKISKLSFNFRCGKTNITRIIPQVCRAIVECYRDETFKLPVCPDDWKRLAAEFEERWQVPDAVAQNPGQEGDFGHR